MTKRHNLYSAALFGILAANAYFFTQAADAETLAATQSASDNVVKTNDFNKMSPEEFKRIYESG